MARNIWRQRGGGSAAARRLAARRGCSAAYGEMAGAVAARSVAGGRQSRRTSSRLRMALPVRRRGLRRHGERRDRAVAGFGGALPKRGSKSEKISRK